MVGREIENHETKKANMKRFNNLFEKIYEYDNLFLAHEKARKGKSYYKEVQKINNNPEKYLIKLQEDLKNQTYKTSKYEIEERVEGRKLRTIYKLPYFPDRIVHHAIMNIVGDIWVKTLIRDTYQSIKGRGIHLAAKRIRKILDENKEETKYCLKIDIKKFYPSIDNEILKQIIRKKIKDKNLLSLLDEIIDSTKGLPIGNYLSQIFGNLYLGEFDHWIKEKKAIKFYFRYCDDCIFLSSSKEELHKLRKETEDYLKDNLKLEVKKNWQIFPIDSRGIDFLGYIFYSSHTLLRKSIKDNFIKKTKNILQNWENYSSFKVINGIRSYEGWLKYGNCFNLKKKFITEDISEILILKGGSIE